MTVYRDDNLLLDEDVYDNISVTLVKQPGRGLGFSIVGKVNEAGSGEGLNGNGLGVFISDFVSI